MVMQIQVRKLNLRVNNVRKYNKCEYLQKDPASQRLTWYKPPLAVLVIKKVRDSTVLSPFVQLVEWLIQEKHMVVWVESAVLDDPLLIQDKKFLNIKDKLVTFK